jgi:hypothetical protein
MWYPPCERYYKEPHSADGQSFIEKHSAGRWEVWFHGVRKAVWRYRRQARFHIRALKRGECFDLPV